MCWSLMCTYVLFIASMEQVQLDFVEMLRVRDERRRMRHVETLRQQKDGGEDEAEVSKGGARVELLGDMDAEKESVVKPQPPVKTSSHSTSSTSSKSRTSISSNKVRRKLLLNFLEENLKKKHLTDLLI